jgi:1-aminocyclopropane-1-carboxylate deaminase/D-cysteine desulfhydrase-like pyridoxal-dependent ACC family enzyme
VATTLDLVPRPTPMDGAPRLAAHLGLLPGDLMVKRDDLIGVAGGGNKVRKLAVSAARAQAIGADVLVTTGASQSNHARATAAVGAMLGVRVLLVLAGEEPPDRSGNVLLDHIFGADIVWAGDRDTEVVADAEASRLSAAGGVVLRVPFGGSSPETAQVYRRAAQEIVDQVPDVRHVVVAVGSGATMAGLVAELGPDRVLGVSSGAVPDARAVVAGFLEHMPGADVRAADLRIDDEQIGPGYEHLTTGVRDALLIAARTQGLLLDPTYTGRAMAGLIAHVAAGKLRRGERVVFVHTGGVPGLFGRADVLPG